MKLKHIMVVSLLLAILTVGAVSANDMDENITATHEDDTISADFFQDDIITAGSGDVLSTEYTVSGKTFSDIQNTVNNAKSGDTITLSGNYVGSGSHIKIDKTLTVEGNGATLDANGLSKIFEITGANVKLNNIHFINGKSNSAGAIDWWNGGKERQTNGVITNCEFKNCQAEYLGGAVYYCDNSLTMFNCSFSGNNAYRGGAVLISGDDCIIDSCKFYENSVNYDFSNSVVACGGAIGLMGQNHIITNCIFEDNTVNMGESAFNINYYPDGPDDYYGAAIGIINDEDNSNILISNSKFDNKFFWYKFVTGDEGLRIKSKKSSNIISNNTYYLAKDTCTFNTEEYGNIGITGYNNVELKKTVISVSDINYESGKSINIVASVKTADGSSVTPGKVLFYVNSGYYLVDVENGKAAINLKIDNSKQTINCIANYLPVFSSTKVYGDSSTKFKLLPKKSSSTVKTTLVLKSVNVKKSAKSLAITATLKKGKTPIKSKKITFKFNGKKYTAKTNSKGVAKVTIKKTVLKKLKVGKKLTYQATYSKLTVKKTVKVKK